VRRYDITMTKAGAILDGGGMIAKVVAHRTTGEAHVTVFVAREHIEKFEKLIDGNSMVKEYFCHPVNPLEEE